jgi:hypothetical protein
MVVVVAHLDLMTLIDSPLPTDIASLRGAKHQYRRGGLKVRLLQCRSRRIAPAQVSWGSEEDRGDESGSR